MPETRGRGKSPKKTEKEEAEVIEVGNEDLVDENFQLSESQLARNRLRERWELASVLNFLQVFKHVLEIDTEISAEDIETGLIRPNEILSQLHISLLKGIPPVSKTLTDPDVWVTILGKKLDDWWQWVAEGEFPLVASRGGEKISRYKDLDPTVRLVILKALCEVRADQNDALDYVRDALKTGTDVSTFRKDQIGENGKGTTYWYDGDSVIGFRLYKEVTRVNHTPRKGKGRLTQPPNSSQWETLATNLEEFMQISSELSSSKVVVEAAVGRAVENDIIPVLVKLQKKKEKALKRQQTQVILMNGFLNTHHGVNRSQRNRKPVRYTFDDYDRSIDEALQISRISNRSRKQKEVEKKDDQEDNKGSSSDSSGRSSCLPEKYGDVDDKNDEEHNTEHEKDNTSDTDDKFQGSGGEDDSDDHNYDDKVEEEDNDDSENDENSCGSSSDSSGRSSCLPEKYGDVDDKNDEEGNTEHEKDNTNDTDDNFQGSGGEDDSDDHNYDDKVDEEDYDENDDDSENDENSSGSEKENIDHDARTCLRNRPQKRKGLSADDTVSLRRSKRTTRQANMELGNHVNSKRSLRSRHSNNTRNNAQVVSDSEDEY